jgi:DNA-directed RNA polymerase subunit RPC12/RpoP
MPQRRMITVRINCTQCGAEQVVIQSDFFLRCPYCEARIIVDPPEDTPLLVEASVSEEYVRRLFPSGMVTSVEMKYFPYLEKGESSSRTILPCFNQPWQELTDYIPPSGDRSVFDDSLAEPDQLIPFDRDMLEESGGRVIFHPFFIVMLKLEGYAEGLIVDALSGKIIGDPPVTTERTDSGTSLYRTFFITLAAGLVITVPIYLLTKDMDLQWLSRIWNFIIVIPIVIALYYFRGKGRRR